MPKILEIIKNHKELIEYCRADIEKAEWQYYC